MSNPCWAVELAASDAAAAQSLRLVPGVEARIRGNDSTLWLRGSELDAESFRIVHQLPCLRRFSLLADGRGVPEGKSVPVVALSGSGWVPLRHLTALKFPVIRAPEAAASGVPLRLALASAESTPSLLCLSFQDWHNYAITAPALRLSPLRFAVSEDARAVVHGAPLPPLPGEFFTVDHGIAAPSGRVIDPPLAHSLLARHFHLSEGDILLFRSDDTCELINASGFASATRGAVRDTARALATLNQ